MRPQPKQRRLPKPRKCRGSNHKRTSATRDQPFQQIWFLVEGRAVRWRCDHHAGLFRVGDDKHGQTEVICTYGKRHQVMSGFLAEAPVGLDDETFPWIKAVIRGVQLLLQFRGRALQIGNP